MSVDMFVLCSNMTDVVQSADESPVSIVWSVLYADGEKTRAEKPSFSLGWFDLAKRYTITHPAFRSPKSFLVSGVAMLVMQQRAVKAKQYRSTPQVQASGTPRHDTLARTDSTQSRHTDKNR